MPNIKPISDLRNYTEVLKETSEGAPVFLTKNGRGESGKGEKTVREEDWVSTEEVEEDYE